MYNTATILLSLLGSAAPVEAFWGKGEHKGCVQIQHNFNPFENKAGSENYKRAEAVKVRDDIQS